MSALAGMMRSTRTKIISREMEQSSETFKEYFNLTEGDFIEVETGMGTWKQLRILSANVCSLGANDVLACLIVMPLLSCGTFGTTRSLYVLCDKKNRNLYATPHRWAPTVKTVKDAAQRYVVRKMED